MIYRVILKIGYYERHFEFTDADKAVNFGRTALTASVPGGDNSEKPVKITMEIVDKEREEQEDE